jgi:hypothetical protein
MDRESFLAKPETPKTIAITLDDGRTVTARKLTQAEVETIKRKYATEAAALEGFRFIVSRCVVNDEGQRVFKDEDHAKLLEVDFDVVQQIASEVVEFSGLNRNAKKA